MSAWGRRASWAHPSASPDKVIAMSRQLRLGFPVAIAIAAGIAGCGSSGSTGSNGPTRHASVSAASWKVSPWPFTVPQGIVACKGTVGGGELTFRAGGTVYALNSVAANAGSGYKDISPIVKRDANGAQVSIGPVIDKGIRLCPR